MVKIIAQFESDIEQINQKYFCSDQTNFNETISSRNFYDSSLIDVFVPNTDIIIGKQLYASVNSQTSADFSKIIQNIFTTFYINYEGIIGTISFNYTVVDSEFIDTPVKSKILNVSGIFDNLNMNMNINQSNIKENRILYTLYID
jgi:hypothetical protein